MVIAIALERRNREGAGPIFILLDNTLLKKAIEKTVKRLDFETSKAKKMVFELSDLTPYSYHDSKEILYLNVPADSALYNALHSEPSEAYELGEIPEPRFMESTLYKTVEIVICKDGSFYFQDPEFQEVCMSFLFEVSDLKAD